MTNETRTPSRGQCAALSPLLAGNLIVDKDADYDGIMQPVDPADFTRIDARGLVERLREQKVLSRDAHGNTLSCTRNPDGTEAADLIEALSATIERMREALDRIADRAAVLRKGSDDWFELVEFEQVARAAMAPKGG